MRAPTTPLVITVLHTDRFDVAKLVLLDELKHGIVQLVNTSQQELPGDDKRQVIFVIHKVNSIGDKMDLAVYISGEFDPRIEVDYGARLAAIKMALASMYDDVNIDVRIDEKAAVIERIKPRRVASRHDDQLNIVRQSNVATVRSHRRKKAEQLKADEARLAELDKTLGLEHDHKPGAPVTHHI